MKIVQVTWEDATGGVRIGWRPLIAMTSPPAIVESVGFLLKEGDVLVIVPHIADEDEGDGEICIPSGWVKKIVELVPKVDLSLEKPKRSKSPSG